MKYLETSVMCPLSHLVSRKPKLAALVTGLTVFFAGISSIVFPTVSGKEGLSTTQRMAHHFHTVNANVEG